MKMNTSDEPWLSDTKTLTIASTTVNLALSLPTNSYVVWLIASGAGGALQAEFFLLNLAVFEILFCLVSAFRFLNMIFSSIDFMSPLATAFLWSGRPVLQCCICLEQFLAVVHPLLFLKYKPLRYKAAFSGLTWTLIVGLSVSYTLCSTVKHLVFVGECVVLVSVMLFCYFSVLAALNRPGPGEGNKGRDNSIKRRAFPTILVIVVSFIGTYLLWCAVILSSLSTWESHDRKILTKTCISVTFATGFVQPLLYLRRTGTACWREAK